MSTINDAIAEIKTSIRKDCYMLLFYTVVFICSIINIGQIANCNWSYTANNYNCIILHSVGIFWPYASLITVWIPTDNQWLYHTNKGCGK